MNKCQIDFLNVGFGACIVIKIRTIAGIYIAIIDGGDYNPGYYEQHPDRTTLEEYLKQNNIQQIDLFVMTHYHRDHIGGILPILDRVPIKQIITNFVLPCNVMKMVLGRELDAEAASLEFYQKILAKISEKQIPIEVVRKIKSVKIEEYVLYIYPAKTDKTDEVLGLLEKLTEQKSLNEGLLLRQIDQKLNRTALAVSLAKNDNYLLLCTSDLPADFWKDEGSRLKEVQIMTAPHHGDSSSLTKVMLKRLNPQHIVICADSFGTYNLPSKNIAEVIQKDSGAAIYYTEYKNAEGIGHKESREVISFRV